MTGRRQNSIGDRVLMALVFLFLYAPIIILIVFSFNAGTSSSVWKGFSLKWYESLLSNRLIMNSVYTTLMVSLLSTIVAAIAGTFAAIGLYAMSRRRRTIVNSVNNIPMMNADIVTGVSLCLLFVVFFNGWGAFAGWVNSWQTAVVLPERLTMGFGTLLIAHVCFNIPYVILAVGPKLRQMDRNLVDAAQDLGCTWMQAFWRVIIPEIKPGIVSGALTAFTMSIDDFIISYFTAGTSSSTLAMTIYGMTKKRVSPEINAVSTLLFVTVILLLALINIRENHHSHDHVRHPARAEAPAPVKPPKKYPGLGKKIAAGGLACVLLATLIVTGTAARSERVVNVCSWGEYIDESLITEFEEQTGIRVNYQTAESNEALYSLIKMGGADFDVIVPSDYMIARLIQEDLLAELDSYIGLGVVKEEVHNLINMVQVYKLRQQHDLPTTDMSLHMVFTGNPGTGKTMMARMMARIYRSLGILSKGQLVEVDRSGLVAGYVGQTALKTQKVIEKAMGGVLFVDEAYALNGRSENDFGQEAIDTLLKAMEDHRDDLVVIVAGYTDLMDKFIHSNPGLESRFNRFLLFEDYSLDELVAIFKMRCGKGYILSPEAEPLVRDYIAEESAAGDSFGNARGVRNIFEHILVAQNNRLAKLETVTRDDLMTLTADDVLRARGKLDE